MTHDITIKLADEAATLKCGAEIAKVLVPGLSIYLHGDLGAGKTTLVRGLLHQLGHAGKVKSPTYTLVEPYQVQLSGGSLNVYHFDLYRFIDPEEWDAAGFRDYFNPSSLCLVEWPEKAGELLPAADIELLLQVYEAGRKLTLRSNSAIGAALLTRFNPNI
ncbi:tRNA (adenosine(37)-N6)-threonylcarbamoyltransferase complex ATPase subunit type 1 TsaE [Methyloradius palustris]|uniref:tRNA threonylcarbamoyladenosine biosynthesis protein TsaE n=1 Tax=Methyloradius palustris TaxID=2778876 RepID=A0A8D5JR67_9PROT|nr:tRNA (adenosine(37)-N6)-threonylcarbamoyltransferase complex ATPase subunit type 1 TsaE [Methyloradius palustris]BCM25166.1 bifunctional tRNA (adenosine(37)-N6)-threonylcarbamoyltransferase complex ATPase subunit type 1 TsaE/phosphotransferase [Methyloradius palustris]